jgi:hypothetical protein
MGKKETVYIPVFWFGNGKKRVEFLSRLGFQGRLRCIHFGKGFSSISAALLDSYEQCQIFCDVESPFLS